MLVIKEQTSLFQFILLCWQKWVILNHTNLKIKKGTSTLSCLRFSTFGFLCFLCLCGVIHADGVFWSFHASPHPPCKRLHSRPPPFICSDSWWRWEQQGKQTYMDLMYHLPPELGLNVRCTRVTAPWLGSAGGHRFKVQQPESYLQLIGWQGQKFL